MTHVYEDALITVSCMEEERKVFLSVVGTAGVCLDQATAKEIAKALLIAAGEVLEVVPATGWWNRYVREVTHATDSQGQEAAAQPDAAIRP